MTVWWTLLDALARTVCLVGIVAGVAVVVTGFRIELRRSRDDDSSGSRYGDVRR